MVFSSIIFLFYFLPIFLIIYFFATKKSKNFVILIFSIFFYCWGAPKFIFVILGTTLIDFYLVKWMYKSRIKVHRNLLLSLSLIGNVGVLIFFKYSNFFIENLNSFLLIFSDNFIHWTKLVLPLGISFYTFETITYVVDIYRNVHKPLNKFSDYLLYIILFPKLIAGPIVRYHDLADQINNRSHKETIENRLRGFYRFGIGLAKKVIIANQMGLQADVIFALDFPSLDSFSAWVGILAFTFQIYFDFSGYSDMAIGIAKMIGFEFPENFNNPYISRSVSEFWRRWHISLGAWMRNYLYIPLGGNKVSSKRRLYFNLCIVFLLSGLWHGASWSFVLWGAYHGLFLVLERGFIIKFYHKIGKLPATIITFFIVVIGWVFFRIENISDAFLFLNKMFSLNFSNLGYFGFEFYFYFFMAIFFAFFCYSRIGQEIHDSVYVYDYSNIRHYVMSVIVVFLIIISISQISAFGFNPFIYFRF